MSERKVQKYHLEKKIRTFLNILLFVGIALILLLLYQLHPFYVLLPWEIFEKNLGYLDIVEILVNICVAALGTTIIYYLILFIYMFRKKNPNWWFWGTILLIIFLFYTGIMIIDSKIGIKVIRLNLEIRMAVYTLKKE